MPHSIEFQTKRVLMLDAYYEIEKQFSELIRIIPLDNNESTYSPNLYTILQMSCGQIESLMRMICDEISIDYKKHLKQNQKPNFPTYYKSINEDKVLSNYYTRFKKIMIGPLSDIWHQSALYPLSVEDSQETPFWWRAYNNTKHNLPDGYKQGNLKNTFYALAALYSIHCMAYYAQFVNKKENFLNQKCWLERIPHYTPNGELVNHDDLPLKSELFFGATHYNEHGAPT